MKLLPDEKSHPGLEVHDENHTKIMTCFQRFWVEEPRQAKTISDPKSDAPIVARVDPLVRVCGLKRLIPRWPPPQTSDFL